MKVLLLATLCGFVQDDLQRQLDAIITRLDSEMIQTRDLARSELHSFCEKYPKEAKALLKKAINRQSLSEEVKAILNTTIRSYPVLKLQLTAPKPIKVGGRFEVDLTLTNVSDDKVSVVRILDGSDGGGRFPLVTVEITGSDGKVVPLLPTVRACPEMWAIRESDIIVLGPGESMKPLDLRWGDGTWTLGDLGAVRDTRPKVACKYKITVRIDFRPEAIERWNGPRERERLTDDLKEKLKAVPRVEVVGEVEVVVGQ